MRVDIILNQMVYQSEEQLDAVFHALSDPTRRALLRQLAAGEATISALAEPFEMSLPAVSKHLRVMEEAALVEREREGRSWRCRLLPEPLHDALLWLQFYQRFWRGQMDSVSEYLQELQATQEPPAKSKPKSTLRRAKPRKSGDRS
jgi:DNA-binding transcriptional ArsR family regulator